MKRILCYGDSNTYGFIPIECGRYAENIRWPGRLKELLGEEYLIIEEGCNGRTCVLDDPREDGKNGHKSLLPCLEENCPVDLVVLMLGSNDLKRYFKVNAEQISLGAEALVKTILKVTEEKQGKPAKLLLMSPPEIAENVKDSMFYPDFDEVSLKNSKEFKRYYRAVAERNGCEFMSAADYVTASELDSLHLDPDAHKKLAEAVAEKIKQIFTNLQD